MFLVVAMVSGSWWHVLFNVNNNLNFLSLLTVSALVGRRALLWVGGRSDVIINRKDCIIIITVHRE